MVVRSVLRGSWLVLVIASCGGESRSHGDGYGAAAAGGASGSGAGSGGVGGGGAGGGSTLPTKDGIPIGDCTDPTPSEQMLAGCPVTEPTAGDGCAAAQEGLVCRYAIQTNARFMIATQDYLVCRNEEWFGPVAQPCSDTCHSALTGIETRTFDTSDCAKRSQIACSRGVLLPLTAQSAMDQELQTLMMECGMNKPYGLGAEIDFVDGCASELITSVSLDPSIVACLQSKLAAVRYDCAVPIPCAYWNMILI